MGICGNSDLPAGRRLEKPERMGTGLRFRLGCPAGCLASRKEATPSSTRGRSPPMRSLFQAVPVLAIGLLLGSTLLPSSAATQGQVSPISLPITAETKEILDH